MEAALGVTGSVCAVFSFSFAAAWMKRGAPFVQTARRKVDAIFADGGLIHRMIPNNRMRHRMHVVDLGSGDGALVRGAVRQGNFGRATGYEINPALVAYARLRSLHNTDERHRLQSLWDADLSDAHLVLVYGVPSMMESLAAKICREMPAGSFVCSNQFAIPSPKRTSPHTARLTEVDRRWVDTGLTDLSLDDAGELILYQVERFSASTDTGTCPGAGNSDNNIKGSQSTSHNETFL